MVKRISQSFIKSFSEYEAGEECGNIIKHQFVDDQLLERDSPSMAEGVYFEYCLTGALPKGGKVPQPERTGKGELTMEYKRAEWNARIVSTMLFDTWGLKIITISKKEGKGIKLTKGIHEGTLDIIVEATKEINGWSIGDRFVIDIKYSGLLYDKWEKHGWMWSNIQKSYHGTQAKQYSYISGLPFYFLVVGNKNLLKDGEWQPTDIKLFYVPVDSHMIETHIEQSIHLFEKFQLLGGDGLEARPSYQRCMKCPLKDGCADKHEYPHPVEVDLTLYV